MAPTVQVEALMTPSMVLALPARAQMSPFADGCRAAALDFVNRVSVRADKHTLAQWLRGPYCRHVVALSPMRTRKVDASGLLRGALERLMVNARQQVSDAILAARDPGDGVAFGYSALAAGHVYRSRDVDGLEGWVPVSHPRMRLVDRVLSLVAADYLFRSDDYENALFACVRCENLVFDASRIEGRVCAAHQSDVRELVPGAVADPERAIA
jgi:hypothetical protein